MAEANKFGKYAKGGGIESLPDVSISGNPNYERPPTQVCGIDAQRFVVLDIFPPKGFDTAAEVEKLRHPVRTTKPTSAEAEG